MAAEYRLRDERRQFLLDNDHEIITDLDGIYVAFVSTLQDGEFLDDNQFKKLEEEQIKIDSEENKRLSAADSDEVRGEGRQSEIDPMDARGMGQGH